MCGNYIPDLTTLDWWHIMLLVFFLTGGHENFAKMIDEAEVLEFPMVVKNTRGHRGGCEARAEGKECSEQDSKIMCCQMKIVKSSIGCWTSLWYI